MVLCWATGKSELSWPRDPSFPDPGTCARARHQERAAVAELALRLAGRASPLPPEEDRRT